MKTVMICIAAVILTCGGLYFWQISPTKTALAKTELISDSIATQLQQTSTALASVKKTKEEVEGNFTRAQEINKAYEAELDTIKLKVAMADSIAKVNIELQAQLAAAQAAAKAKPATGKSAQKSVAAKSLKAVKGQITFNADSTVVTYFRSDSLAMATKVPTSFKGKTLVATR